MYESETSNVTGVSLLTAKLPIGLLSQALVKIALWVSEFIYSSLLISTYTVGVS